jgi:hypothetical protein
MTGAEAKRLRKETHLSLEAVARHPLVGVNPATLFRWERRADRAIPERLAHGIRLAVEHLALEKTSRAVLRKVDALVTAAEGLRSNVETGGAR